VEGSFTLTVTVPALQLAEAVVGASGCEVALRVAAGACETGTTVHAADIAHVTMPRAKHNLKEIGT
jgi:hypothetical protein